MAYSVSWPLTLPQVPQKGYGETGGVLLSKTPTDAGPAKLRKIGQKPQVLNVSFIMTGEQLLILENFIKNTLGGVKRFGFPHPRLNVVSEVRLVPRGDGGELYNLSYIAPNYYNVSLDLEILP